MYNGKIRIMSIQFLIRKNFSVFLCSLKRSCLEIQRIIFIKIQELRNILKKLFQKEDLYFRFLIPFKSRSHDNKKQWKEEGFEYQNGDAIFLEKKCKWIYIIVFFYLIKENGPHKIIFYEDRYGWVFSSLKLVQHEHFTSGHG